MPSSQAIFSPCRFSITSTKIEASASEEIKTEAGGKSILRKTRLNEMTVKRWEDN